MPLAQTNHRAMLLKGIQALVNGFDCPTSWQTKCKQYPLIQWYEELWVCTSELSTVTLTFAIRILRNPHETHAVGVSPRGVCMYIPEVQAVALGRHLHFNVLTSFGADHTQPCCPEMWSSDDKKATESHQMLQKISENHINMSNTWFIFYVIWKKFTLSKHIAGDLECRNCQVFHVSKSGELLEFNPRRSLDQSSIPCKMAAGNTLWLLPASSFKMTLKMGAESNPSIIWTPTTPCSLQMWKINSYSPPPVEVVFCASSVAPPVVWFWPNPILKN